MRIYIAGPMTGYDNHNFPSFDAMRDRLRSLGHVPVSPADLCRAVGFEMDAIPHDKPFIKAAIQRDLAGLLDCDAIVLLPGWSNSKGARAEKAVAEWFGLAVYLHDDEIFEGARVA